MVDRIRTNSIFRRVRGPPRGSPPVRLPCLFSRNLTRSSHDASRGHSIPPLPLQEGAGVGERGGARVEGTRFPDRVWEFDLKARNSQPDLLKFFYYISRVYLAAALA